MIVKRQSKPSLRAVLQGAAKAPKREKLTFTEENFDPSNCLLKVEDEVKLESGIDTVEFLEEVLNDKLKLHAYKPDIIQTAIKAMESKSKDLALAVVLHHIAQLAASTGTKIKERENTSEITMSAITLLFADSGAGKDKTKHEISFLLEQAYEILNSMRSKDIAVETGLGTAEGLVSMMFDNQKEEMSALNVYSGEFTTEIKVGKNIHECMKVISEGFDRGYITQKTIKSKEEAVGTIKGLNITALLVGSPEILRSDKKAGMTMTDILVTQLARRSMISYPNYKVLKTKKIDVNEFLQQRSKQETKRIPMQKAVRDYFNKFIELISQPKLMVLDEQAYILHGIFREFCEQVAEHNKLNLTYKLNIQGRAFIALKMAGVIALIRGKDVIEEEDYTKGIYYVEKVNGNIKEFLEIFELTKADALLILIKNKNHDNGTITGNELVKNKIIQDNYLMGRNIEELVNTFNNHYSEYKLVYSDTNINYKKRN